MIHPDLIFLPHVLYNRVNAVNHKIQVKYLKTCEYYSVNNGKETIKLQRKWLETETNYSVNCHTVTKVLARNQRQGL
jgi:hypothetical protein